MLQVSADTEPELFWGLRGGGGNFGIAASLEFEAHPLDTILGGIVAYPLSEALPVFAAYQEATAEPPDELVSFFGLVHAPDGSGDKIVAVPVCHSGDIATGEALVAPLRTVGTPAVDLIGPMPYPVMNTLLDDAFPKGARNYWRSAFFKELSDDVVGVLVDAFERVPSPMSGMLIEHFHGAVTRIDPTATAYPHREPGYNLVITGEWLDPAEDEANIAWVRSTFEALTPVHGRRRVRQLPERRRARAGARRVRAELGAARRAEADVGPRQRLPPQPEHPPHRLNGPTPTCASVLAVAVAGVASPAHDSARAPRNSR